MDFNVACFYAYVLGKRYMMALSQRKIQRSSKYVFSIVGHRRSTNVETTSSYDYNMKLRSVNVVITLRLN